MKAISIIMCSALLVGSICTILFAHHETTSIWEFRFYNALAFLEAAGAIIISLGYIIEVQIEEINNLTNEIDYQRRRAFIALKRIKNNQKKN